jgi:hypothetical protein
MENVRQRFLSGENTNYVVQEIIKPLNTSGIDVNIKDVQQKIFNFMNEVYNRYPNESMQNLNNFVIQKSIEKYQKNQTTGPNLATRKGTGEATNSLFERELMERKYKQAQAGSQNNQSTGPSSGISLNQAITGQVDPSPPDRNGPPPPASTRVTDRTNIQVLDQNTNQGDDQENNEHNNSHGGGNYGQKNLQSYGQENRKNIYSSNNDEYNEILLSLSNDDIVDIEGDKFTFCWNHKFLSNFGDDFSIELKYATLPKNLSHILVKYGELDDSLMTSNKNKRNMKANETNMETNKLKVYNALGKNYNAKLIPSHSSEQYTTYQAIQSSPSQSISKLPSTLTFQMIAPMSQRIELNVIPVQKIIKTEKTIQVSTKGPHNLNEDDQLTLEFSQQHICYRITGLEIQSDRQISFNSPFNGYFSSDFKLIKNNWNIDLTLVCRYRTK